jgi:hypothetical protein
MSPGPTEWREMIRKFRNLGYEGPKHAKGHSYMVRGKHKVKIFNDHSETISGPGIGRMLSRAGISEEEWDNA